MSDLQYTTSLDDVTPTALGGGFFAGWSAPIDPHDHLAVLKGSSHVVLARDGSDVVGFVTAVSDGVLAAYVPLLEVLPAYRGRGVGTELVRRVLADIGPLYMIDVMCDPDVFPFYERLGFTAASGAVIRNYGDRRSRER